ncbi:MAG: signal peptidase I [Candidatus Thorarchaeota archaeon]
MMEKARQTIRWSQWPELAKTGFLVVLIIGVTLGGFGLFTLGMGTSTPLVVVTSESMSPNLERGHLLVLQNQAPESIEVDDVIVFHAGWHTEAPVVHRVVQRDFVDGEYHYWTQGDNNFHQDPTYTVYEDILGVVVSAIPYVGYITLTLQEPGVLPLVILALIVIIILPEFLPKKDTDSSKTENEETPVDNDVPNV